jgi:polysaccharide deacetylase family protein (PEP-CTERM system associated)
MEATRSALTIDLEEWFCICGDDYFGDPRRWNGFESRIESTTASLFAELASANTRATFFTLGWIAEKFPDLVREIAARGHEVALHGRLHRRCDQMSTDDFRREVSDGRDTLQKISGSRVVGFRAPQWSLGGVDDPRLECLAAEGFRYDASLLAVPPLGRSDGPRNALIIRTARGELAEFPALVGSAYGYPVPFGGSWPFRQLRFSRILGEARKRMAEGSPAVFWFHPWEFDDEPPPLSGVAPFVRLVINAHRRRFPSRFRRLLRELPLAPLQDLL